MKVSVSDESYVPPMACVPITPAMRQLLEVLTAWPDVETDDLRRRPEWEQARAWGWVMESGELTGTGLGHAKELWGGLVRD